MHLNRFRILGGAVLAAGVGFLVFTSTSNCLMVTGSDTVNVNVSAMRPGRGQLYCYTDDAGRKLRFVLARGTDGKVRSVFDACRQCFTFHRGYRVVDGELICRVCGNHYRIDRMAEGKASCVPVSLPHEDASGVARIRTTDLEAGRAFF
jgi:uncharacterized membrane protein